jgi:hypothetical protein
MKYYFKFGLINILFYIKIIKTINNEILLTIPT